MDQQMRTSFIPKKPIGDSSDSSLEGTGMGFFSLITFMIFIATVAFSVGVFVWEKTLLSQIETQKSELKAARDSFDSGFIDQATRLSNRIQYGRERLDMHTALTALFDILERNTLHTISFGSFSFVAESDTTLRVSASGVGEGFESIVLQSDRFGETDFFRDVLFSNLQQTDDGIVTFSFESTVEAQPLFYLETINASGTTTISNESEDNLVDGQTDEEELPQNTNPTTPVPGPPTVPQSEPGDTPPPTSNNDPVDFFGGGSN